ncbi:MAG: HD domain-containing protein [Bacteroidetes bacterium]|nr:HD domain-containing protein [Bacteroidota bacterium]
MKDQKDFKDLKPGEKALHYCLVSKVEQKATKTGKTYLNLELQDGSAILSAKMWDGFGDVLPSLKAGSLIKVSAKVDEYLGQTQLIIDKIRITDVSDNIHPEDFMPKSSRDLDTMIAELNDRISEIKNTYLKKLVDTILSGTSFEKYIRVPAGKSWHHSYIHGLLEHTLEIIRICDLISEFHPEVNKDILITGAILHDFGKTEELSYEDSFDYTDKGRLLGHIVIAANLIEKTANGISGFPEDLKTQVIHLVLSHQGKLEYASPVEPKTLEAIILYHADELSAKSNAYKLAILNEKGSGNKWTKFLHLAGTSLYIPATEEEENKTTLFD